MARKPLFERLPESWKYNDSKTSQIDGKGELQRYLEVWDNGFDRSEDLVESILETRDINTIPDKYLRLIGDLVGYRWKEYRSYQWNRQKIRTAISRYSYKGTSIAITDSVYEHGGVWCKILDMASLVGVYDRQGSMTQSSHYFDADFFHQGVYQLWLPDGMDMEHFLEDFEYLKPAGTKWIIRICISECYSDIEFLDYSVPISIYGANYDYTYKLFDMEFGFYNHIPQKAYDPIVLTTLWSYIASSFPNIYGSAFYNFIPQYPVEPVIYNTVWAVLGATEPDIFGEAFYNFKLQFPVSLTITLFDNIGAVANARLDMGTLSFNMEDPFEMTDEFIPENLNWRQPLVEPIILT